MASDVATMHPTISVRPSRSASSAIADGPARTFRLEVPESAVEGIARCPGGHRALQAGAIEPPRQLGSHRPYRLRHVGNGLAIAGIGDALAAPAMIPTR